MAVMTERFITEPVVDLVTGNTHIPLGAGKCFVIFRGVAMGIEGADGHELCSALVEVTLETVVTGGHCRLGGIVTDKALRGIAAVFTSVERRIVLVQPCVWMKPGTVGMAPLSVVGAG